MQESSLTLSLQEKPQAVSASSSTISVCCVRQTQRESFKKCWMQKSVCPTSYSHVSQQAITCFAVQCTPRSHWGYERSFCAVRCSVPYVSGVSYRSKVAIISMDSSANRRQRACSCEMRCSTKCQPNPAQKASSQAFKIFDSLRRF